MSSPGTRLSRLKAQVGAISRDEVETGLKQNLSHARRNRAFEEWSIFLESQRCLQTSILVAAVFCEVQP